MKDKVPGSVYINNGRWYWRIKFPGSTHRQAIPLKPPGGKKALPASKDRAIAESVAWRYYEKATRDVASSMQQKKEVNSVCAAFLRWADAYYRRSDGTATGEAYKCELSLRVLRGVFGNKDIDEITYHDIIAIRDSLVERGLMREVINQRIGIIKRFFAWALENRHCSAKTKSEVWAIENLKKHRSLAPEGNSKRPARHRDVKAVLPYLPPTVQALVAIQELCGARPVEMCLMRPCDIDTRGDVWIYEPRRHKTEHHGRPRLIALGSRAQRYLSPLLESTPPDQTLFRPIDAQQWRKKKLGRKTGGQEGKDAYNKTTYARTVRTACQRAMKEHPELVTWTPNQLRHACATRVRRRFGGDAARHVLGHSDSKTRVTDRYTIEAIKKETRLAIIKVMRQIG